MKNIIDAVAIGFLFIIGLFFFIISTQVFQNVRSDCSSTFVKNGWCLIQALSVCLITAGLGYAVCNMKGNCYIDYVERNFNIYIITYGIIFLFITLLSAGILAEYKKLTPSEIDNCDSKNKSTQSLTEATLGMCVFGIVVCVSVFFYTNYYKN